MCDLWYTFAITEQAGNFRACENTCCTVPVNVILFFVVRKMATLIHLWDNQLTSSLSVFEIGDYFHVLGEVQQTLVTESAHGELEI